MKFLSIFISSAILTCSTVSTPLGNMRNLQAYNCLQYDALGKCTQCVPRAVNINGECHAVSDLCKVWDSTGACTECYTGYNLSSVTCVSNQTSGSGSTGAQDTLCVQWNANGNCTFCTYGAYISNGKCQKVSERCQDWDNQTGACTSCIDDYTLSNGKCLDQSSSSGQTGTGSTGSTGSQDPLCVQSNTDGSCSLCSFRSVLINCKCKAVSDLCKEWNQTSGQCTSCYIGYNLNNGVCSV